MKVGDTITHSSDRRFRWVVEFINGDFIGAKPKHPRGRTPILAIYRTRWWSKVR